MRVIQYGFLLAVMACIGFSQEQPAGDAARGKALFEGQTGCRNCHRIQGQGGRIGPDLTVIGSARSAEQLRQSILDPDAEISPQNRPYRVITKTGETINGRLLNQDTFTVQILDSKEQLRSFSKDDLRDYEFIDKSPMPSFRGKLSLQELADLVAYLSSLKAPDRPNPPGAPQGRGAAEGGANPRP